MYNELDKVFYIDIFDGIVKEGNFKEYAKKGLWIRINEEGENVFVYSDLNDEKVYNQRDSAEAGLVKIRAEMMVKLLQNKLSFNDICKKLEQYVGKLYVGIIKEILNEKVSA
jgi:hypothetical protein